MRYLPQFNSQLRNRTNRDNKVLLHMQRKTSLQQVFNLGKGICWILQAGELIEVAMHGRAMSSSGHR